MYLFETIYLSKTLFFLERRECLTCYFLNIGLFCKTERRKCDEVIKAVKVYGKSPGQCINFDKSSHLFLAKGFWEYKARNQIQFRY